MQLWPGCNTRHPDTLAASPGTSSSEQPGHTIINKYILRWCWPWSWGWLVSLSPGVRVWFCQLFAPLTATGQWIGCCNAVMLNTGIIARLAQSRTSSSRLQVCSALVWVCADNKHNNPKLFVNLYDVKKIVRFLSRTLIRGATTASQNTWKNVIPSVFIWLMVFCSESQFFENHEIPLYF